MDNFECGGYIFNSKFDSGNLGRVELVRNCPDTEIIENIIHAEYNVWTNPDCHGTPYENPNRTWFFFSIKGGRPYRNVKINVRNLNRQAKLFSQGMQPVVRIGQNGKWERIKDKPTFTVEIDNFSIAFIHHPLDKPDIEHFYAFTYPFTYTECQNMMDKFDKKFQKSVHDINFIINRLASFDHMEKMASPRESSIGSMSYTDMVTTPSPNNSDGYEESTLSTESESIYDKLTKKDLLNEIYYHRELLIKSLEGRRVDLLTISSFHGIKDEREERLTNMFPDHLIPRCHVFKDKKIIFLSSRVHPGETPASFVLNGFLNLILDKKSIIGSTLRQLYVFKIVPFLNPDGVYNGLYRTDTLGHNLNRMYINPKLDVHPTIYAVKKLIRFYHFGFDKFDEENNSPKAMEGSSTDSSISGPDNKIIMIEKEIQIMKENLNMVKQDASPPSSFSDEFPATNCSSKESTSSEGEENIKSRAASASMDRQMKPRVFTEKLIPEIKAIPTEPVPKKISLGSSFCKKALETKNRKNSFKTVFGASHASTSRNNTENKLKEHTTNPQRGITKKIVQRKDYKGGSAKSGSSFSGNTKAMNKKNILSNHNINISSDFANRSDEAGFEKGAVEDKSNMFLYIDFHGHASKKGVFMYGNHFSNSAEAVECMLLPRLMSVNCHHFHYDACNFSERNMYRKEKRDGLSKEGSGRVAVYKMTGLIKSYTLESNYNSGKYVNILPPRGKDNVAKSTNIVPPKYTPAIYEEAGRALGPSILDLTNSNQLSRIHNSDFRTIQGLRITLRNEIDRNFSQRSAGTVNTTAKVLSPHQNVKRNKRNALSGSAALPLQPSNNDVSKENKVIYTVPWDNLLPSTSSAQNLGLPTAGQSTSKLQLRIPRSNLKKMPIKVRSTNLYEKKDSSASLTKKKLKSLIDVASGSGLKDQGFQVPPKKVKVSPKLKEVAILGPSSSQHQVQARTSGEQQIILKSCNDDNEKSSALAILSSNQLGEQSHVCLKQQCDKLASVSLTGLTTATQLFNIDTPPAILPLTITPMNTVLGTTLKKCTSESGLSTYSFSTLTITSNQPHLTTTMSQSTATIPASICTPANNNRNIVDDVDAVPCCSRMLLNANSGCNNNNNMTPILATDSSINRNTITTIAPINNSSTTTTIATTSISSGIITTPHKTATTIPTIATTVTAKKLVTSFRKGKKTTAIDSYYNNNNKLTATSNSSSSSTSSCSNNLNTINKNPSGISFKMKSALVGIENPKLLKKKRIVRRDSLIVKRKKSKIKSVRH